MSADIKLLRCPFCGSAAHLQYDPLGLATNARVHCVAMDCRADVWSQEGKDAAVAMWNKRAAASQQPVDGAQGDAWITPQVARHLDIQYRRGFQAGWMACERDDEKALAAAQNIVGTKAEYAEAFAAHQPAAGEVKAAPTPLFDRKLADLQQRGYEVIGRILHKDGEYALFDSSCRWLTRPQYQRLMHEQDGSLFAAAAPQAVDLSDEQIDEVWESLPGLTLISGKPQDQWNRIMRHEFVRALLSAGGKGGAQ